LPPRAYAELLNLLAPPRTHPDLSYRLSEYHPGILHQIVLISTRLEEFHQPHSAETLATCLEYLCHSGIEPLLAYTQARLKFYIEKRHEGRYLYDFFPYRTNLGFVRQHAQYRTFLEFVLNLLMVGDADSRSFCFELLESILGSAGRHAEEDAFPEFDPVTYQIFTDWLNGTPEQFGVAVDVLRQIHPWNSWFGLIRQIVVRKDVRVDWNDLIASLHIGFHAGPSSQYYQSRLDLLRRHRRDDDSTAMRRFFDRAEAQLQRLIEREQESEKMEEILERTWRR